MESSEDENYKEKKKKKKIKTEYHGFITRLPSANPDLKWHTNKLGPIKSSYIKAFNLTKKWAMITDPYNPRARRSGILFFYLS